MYATVCVLYSTYIPARGPRPDARGARRSFFLEDEIVRLLTYLLTLLRCVEGKEERREERVVFASVFGDEKGGCLAVCKG